MPTVRLAALIAGALVGLCAAVEATSQKDEDRQTDIFVVNADGSGRRDLTKESALYDDDPALSPDGRTLAFDRFHVEGETNWRSIATMASRGGPLREVFGDSEASAYGPAWSRDGQLLAFNSCCSERIGIVSSDGNGLTWIPDAGRPAWLTGRRLLFGMEISDAGPLGIAVAKADGSERRVVVRGTDVGLMLIEYGPLVSPNGRSVAFSAIDGRGNFGRSYLMTLAAGSRPRALGRYGSATPSWSPTGRRVVFVDGGLWTVAPGGKRPRYFPATAHLNPTYPAWSPDGTRVAFIAYRSYYAKNDLVVLNVRHRTLRVVARRVKPRKPVWSWNSRRLYYVAPSPR